jgi:hypothetical protein
VRLWSSISAPLPGPSREPETAPRDGAGLRRLELSAAWRARLVRVGETVPCNQAGGADILKNGRCHRTSGLRP